jgi:hypothetical protein
MTGGSEATRGLAGRKAWAAGLLAAIGLTGCPGAAPAPAPAPGTPPAPPWLTAPDHNTLALERAACQAFAGPSAAPVVAAAEPADAPLLARDRAYAVAVPTAPGYVAIEVPREAEWSVCLDAERFFLVQDPTGEVQPGAEDGGPSGVCPAVVRHEVFLLGPGRRYTLELASGEAGPLRLYVGETHPDAPVAATPTPGSPRTGP